MEEKGKVSWSLLTLWSETEKVYCLVPFKRCSSLLSLFLSCWIPLCSLGINHIKQIFSNGRDKINRKVVVVFNVQFKWSGEMVWNSRVKNADKQLCHLHFYIFYVHLLFLCILIWVVPGILCLCAICCEIF